MLDLYSGSVMMLENKYKTILKILITLPGRNIYNIPPDRIIEIDGNDIYVFGKNGNSFFTLESMDWLTDCLDSGKIIKLEGNYGKESYIQGRSSI